MNSQPLVSVLVVNYKGLSFLPRFYESLFRQTYGNIEVILVDNDSQDGSIEYTKNHYPQVLVVENKDNSGYAEGNNIALRHSKGEYVLIMNNDTTLKEDLVETLLGAFSEIPNLGVVQPMVRLMDDPTKLDACGSFWTNTGFNYHYGIYKSADLALYNRSFPVYSIKGMCMMTPRKVIDEVGLFDPDFWCFFEETDFCHRLLLAGYECWYYPKTFINHHLGGSSRKKPSSLIQFHSFKNRLCSYLKNLGLWELFKILPPYLLLNFIWSVGFVLKLDFQNAAVVYRAIGWNIGHFKETLEKRRFIQQRIRKRTDQEVFAKVTKRPRLSYYWYLFKGLQHYQDIP